MGFSVLVVCTGNICRSPVAERLLRSRIASGDVTVSSAGTSGLVGHGIDGPSGAALAELGIDPTGHQARRIDLALLRAADLVLTASAEHRTILLEAEPLLLHRAFTLREFARLLGGLTPVARGSRPSADDLRARTAAAASQRGAQTPVGGSANDIGDPFGGTLADARASVADIAVAVEQIVAGLGLADESGPPEPPGAAGPPGPVEPLGAAVPLGPTGSRGRRTARHRA